MFETPEYLSPSSITTYRECPMKFKFSRIDRIVEPPTWHTHIGTFVHEVLEHFYQLDAEARTIDSVKAMATERSNTSEWEAQVTALEKPMGSIVDFKKTAFECMTNLWKIEDPQQTELINMEYELFTDVEGVRMKGYVDRFLYDEDDGKLIISDYKTGAIPNPKFKSEDEKYFQLLAYALMFESADQEETSKLQLLYLKHSENHEISVTPVKLAVARGVIVETKEAIDQACATENFACNKTRLCDWCFHKPYCPAHQ